tara:strand:- start:23 stop:403 length:381 start_codon:yes stop_codon:yes gene_type:complete
MNKGLPMNILSESEIETAEEWAGKNISDSRVREIFGKMILQGRKYLYHSQIPVEESDCALVMRPWGNEIYISDRIGRIADEARLNLAVAVRAIAAKDEDPDLWGRLIDFPEDIEEPDLKLLMGGKH